MGEQIKRIKRELQCKGSITDYYNDTVVLPDGREEVWDFVGHKGAAATVAVLPNGKLLMVSQYRNALDRQTIEIPAGGLKTPEEPTMEAAKRELKEETGYTCGSIEPLLTIRTTVAFCNEKIDIYLARDLEAGEQELDDDEYVDVKAYELSELEEMIYNATIQDSKTIAGILAYKNKYVK